MGFLNDTLGAVSGFLGGQDSSTTNPSMVYGAQDPYLKDLYSRAQFASFGNQGQNFANQINQGAQTGYQNQLGGGYQNQNLAQGLQNFGGMQNEDGSAGIREAVAGRCSKCCP